METQELVTAFQTLITTEFSTLLIDVIIAGIIIFLIKIITESIANYILFRLDQHVGIGTAIEVYGKPGRIKIVTFFNITVETADGYIRIPTRHWRTSKYIVLKDVPLVKNRRRDDRTDTSLRN